MSFQTADQAAIYILRIINRRSIIENVEYGGYIYRERCGLYNYTVPISGGGRRRGCSGQVDRANVSLDGIQVPAGTVEVGCYHTHGDYSVADLDRQTGCAIERRTSNINEIPLSRTAFGIPMRAGEHFSDLDVEFLNKRGKHLSGYRGYLGAPSGTFYYYDPPRGRSQYVLFRDRRP